MPENKVHTTDLRACCAPPGFAGHKILLCVCWQHGQTFCFAGCSAWQFDAHPSLLVTAARLEHLNVHVSETGLADRRTAQLQLQC